MNDTLRYKAEQIIRNYGSKEAPLSPNDIRAELGLTGRDKLSGTLSRMMRSVKGLRRVERRNAGAPPHFCYWIESPATEVTPRSRGDIQNLIHHAVRSALTPISSEAVAQSTGLTVRQVITNCSKLATKRKLKRSIFEGVIFMRPPRMACADGHTDYSFSMFRSHKGSVENPTQPDKDEPTIAPQCRSGAVIRIPVQGNVFEFNLLDARAIYEQLKGFFG